MTTPYRTPPQHAEEHPSGRAPLPSGVWVSRLPLVDAETDLFARLTYRDALAVAKRLGGRLPTRAEVHELAAHGFTIPPVTLSYGPEMLGRGHAETHDARVGAHLVDLRWDLSKAPVMNAGKHWVSGAAPGRARICGWWRDGKMIQAGTSDVHDDLHHDYATTTVLVWGAPGAVAPPPDSSPGGHVLPEPPPTTTIITRTLREGLRGDDVRWLQTRTGATADGIFGPGTARAVRAAQAARGLVADALAGQRTVEALGGIWRPAPGTVVPVGYSDAPACRSLLRSATEAFPGRSRVSDGIAGDMRHQFSPGPDGVLGTSDDVRKPATGHNAGNAVDLTHDPDSGCDCEELADLLFADDRCLYQIWRARIRSKTVSPGVWRPYSGANRHDHHMHVEIRPELRADGRPWRMTAG